MALKKTSETIVISSTVFEPAANTFTSERVDLQLNPLDNEVFIVQAINLDAGAPDAIAGTNSQTLGSLSTTARTTVGGLANSDVLARVNMDIRAAGFVDGGVGFTQISGETPASTLDYIGIIATNDFFLNITGNGNVNPKQMSCKVYGYRAKADSATYAALVQSELLSAN